MPNKNKINKYEIGRSNFKLGCRKQITDILSSKTEITHAKQKINAKTFPSLIAVT